MSVAAYGQDSQWEIPALVWPAVLGLSVALHLSVLLFGLPSLPWQAEDPLVQPETELIIESGGLPFENLLAVEAETANAAIPDIAPVAEPADLVQPLVTPAEAASVEPVDAPALQPVGSSAIAPVASPVQELQEITPDLPGTVEAVDVAEVDVETLALSSVQENVQDTAAAEPSGAAVVETVQPVLPSTGDTIPVTEAPAVETVVAAATTVPEVSSASEPLVPTVSDEITVAEIPALEVTPANDPVVSTVAPEAIVSAAPDIAELTPAVTPQADEPVEADEATVAFVPPAPSVEPDQPVALPQNVTPAEALQSQPAEVLTPTVSEAVSPVTTGDLPEVTATEQQVASVQPTETELEEIAPSAPASASVPVTAPTEPTENVPPVDVASIDPLASVTDFVASYDFGDCAHLSVLSAGADTAKVSGYAVNPMPFVLFDQHFTAENGYEASIDLNIVSRKQCALLDALGLAGGIEAADLVSLQNTVVKSGTQVNGVIQRDLPLDRIAAAEQSGLDLSGRGPPELYLIDNDGQIHDGRDYLLPASNSQTAGGWKFTVPVTLLSDGDDELALVLAIWNRPASRQPARFGTQPANRIAALLSEPGVYSLTAFKVAR
ncbi:hypothetical protein [Roseibium sp. M-1]